MDWHQLWTILQHSGQRPHRALLFVVPFYTWYGLRQALANDRLIAQLEADPQWPRRITARPARSRAGPRKCTSGPYLLRIEFLAAIIVTVILMVWSITLNAPLEEPANPNLTMNPAKAPVVLPGLAGNAGLLRSVDGRRGHALADHRRA